MAERCIAHLDMDAFYVSAELRRRPELRGRPVIVAGDGPRSVVTTASYEAREFGVHSAIPAARARTLCPQGVFLTPDFPYYRAVSAEVMGIVRAHVDQVEQLGLDEIYLDLSGWPAPKAAMRGIVREIRERTGLAASVGIGPNKLIAKVASDAEKPHGFVVLSREQACERFASSPCRLIPGIGPRTVERLLELDITTIGELRHSSPERLRLVFATNTCEQLLALSNFRHEGAVTEVRKAQSESRERTFDVDVHDRRELVRILDRLAGELCAELVRKGRAGRTIGIKIRYDDFSTHTRDRSLTRAVNDFETVVSVARELLAAFDPRQPVRLLGVRVAGLVEPGAVDSSEDQLQLFES